MNGHPYRTPQPSTPDNRSDIGGFLVGAIGGTVLGYATATDLWTLLFFVPFALLAIMLTRAN